MGKQQKQYSSVPLVVHQGGLEVPTVRLMQQREHEQAQVKSESEKAKEQERNENSESEKAPK